jgi:hypothetical protein
VNAVDADVFVPVRVVAVEVDPITGSAMHLDHVRGIELALFPLDQDVLTDAEGLLARDEQKRGGGHPGEPQTPERTRFHPPT